jgi:hypothetical protein
MMAVVTLGGALRSIAQTPEERTSLRDVAVKRGDAVVRVLATRKTRTTINGRETSSEVAVQANAVVLDATGLAVTSLYSFEIPEAMARAQADAAPAGTTRSISTETVDLRMHLSDGREVPAKIVLRDADLDLMFIKPVTALSPAVPVLDAPSGKPSIMEPLIVVQRTNETTGWRIAPLLAYIQIIVDKPRTFYVGSGLASLGAPVFDTNGRFIGLLVQIAGTKTAPAPAILPADDLREIAKQATGK